MNQITTIIITSIITAVCTNFFGFIKEKKLKSLAYTDSCLKKIYIPIYQILIRDIIPNIGYDGINQDQVSDIRHIIENNPEYTDPELKEIVDSYFQEMYMNVTRLHADQVDPRSLTFDKDEKLYKYILFSFHTTRRSLGLPYNRKYAFKFLYKLQYLFRKKSDT